MKSILLQTKLGLLATIASIGLAGQSEAAVTWLVSDNGSDLTLTTTGSINITGSIARTGTFDYGGKQGLFRDDNSELYGSERYYRFGQGIGGVIENDPWLSTTVTSSVTGHSFGHSGGRLLWDPLWGDTPGVITPVTTMVFSGLTISEALGTSLDSGPLFVWRHVDTGDTISLALAVPEPSSTALLSLGGLALILRRRV